MINSFIKGEGYGFNFYLNDNNNESDKNIPNKMSKAQNNFSLKKEQPGEEIEKLLNYYMKELNNSNFDTLITFRFKR